MIISNGMEIFTSVNTKLTETVIFGEKRFYIGIINHWGVGQLEPFPFQTKPQMTIIRDFVESISKKFNPSAKSQDFSLFFLSDPN